MNKKIICFLVCILFFATSLPAIEAINLNYKKVAEKNRNLENELSNDCGQVTIILTPLSSPEHNVGKNGACIRFFSIISRVGNTVIIDESDYFEECVIFVDENYPIPEIRDRFAGEYAVTTGCCGEKRAYVICSEFSGYGGNGHYRDFSLDEEQMTIEFLQVYQGGNNRPVIYNKYQRLFNFIYSIFNGKINLLNIL